MPNPFPRELREQAVRAYEAGADSIPTVAAVFGVSVPTLQRWITRQRRTGTVDPLARGGGWISPVDTAHLLHLVDARPDRTLEELTRAYNRGAPLRVHRSSIVRALERAGYVHKKNGPGRWNWIASASSSSASASARGSRPSTRRGSSSSTNLA
jgi:transposase